MSGWTNGPKNKFQREFCADLTLRCQTLLTCIFWDFSAHLRRNLRNISPLVNVKCILIAFLEEKIEIIWEVLLVWYFEPASPIHSRNNSQNEDEDSLPHYCLNKIFKKRQVFRISERCWCDDWNMSIVCLMRFGVSANIWKIW